VGCACAIQDGILGGAGAENEMAAINWTVFQNILKQHLKSVSC
jgi:hypothetical protein